MKVFKKLKKHENQTFVVAQVWDTWGWDGMGDTGCPAGPEGNNFSSAAELNWQFGRNCLGTQNFPIIQDFPKKIPTLEVKECPKIGVGFLQMSAWQKPKTILQ